ncbi:pyrokinin-1 receptor-like isoform X2 [Liolophura sinensis]
MTYYSSVLTLTAFTVERYVAICHPIRSQTLSGLSRAVKAIIITWILACLCALPYAICTRVFYYVTDHSGEELKESLLCNIPQVWIEEMKFVFQVSTFAFFVGPMTLITVLYIQIGRKIHKSEVCTNTADRTAITAAFRARRAVLRMLVAVVVAFFICWAPFHAQRLMTLYIKRDDWNEELIVVQSHLFYVSGILYFFSSTVNPILYNLLSRKYRQAFKRTLCRCCIDMEGLPSFYKLKAKFNIRQAENPDSHSSVRYLYPEKPILVATYNNNNENRKQEIVPRKCVPSSKETYIKLTTKGGSGESSSGSSSGHAHSDGRLHYHCRHKMSCCRRHCQGLDPQLGRQYLSRSFNNIYYCDTESKRPKRRTRDQKRLPVATFDSTCQCRDWRIDATML